MTISTARVAGRHNSKSPSTMSKIAPPTRIAWSSGGLQLRRRADAPATAARPGPSAITRWRPEQRQRPDRERLEQIEPREPAVLHARRMRGEDLVEALRLDPGRGDPGRRVADPRRQRAARARSSAPGCASRASRARRRPAVTSRCDHDGSGTSGRGRQPSQRRIASDDVAERDAPAGAQVPTRPSPARRRERRAPRFRPHRRR